MLAQHYAVGVKSIWREAVQDSVPPGEIAEFFKRNSNSADSLFAGTDEKVRESHRRYRPSAKELLPAYAVLEEMVVQRDALVDLICEPQGSLSEFNADVSEIQTRIRELEWEWKIKMGT